MGPNNCYLWLVMLPLHGLWFMVHGPWSMVHGPWFMVHGSWFTPVLYATRHPRVAPIQQKHMSRTNLETIVSNWGELLPTRFYTFTSSYAMPIVVTGMLASTAYRYQQQLRPFQTLQATRHCHCHCPDAPRLLQSTPGAVKYPRRP